MKLLLSLFVIAHGLIHVSYLTPKPDDPRYPFDFSKGWFASFAGSSSAYIGTIITVIVIVSFVLAGLGMLAGQGMLGVPGLVHAAKILIAIGVVSSTILLTLYWHPWIVLGFAINAALFYGIYKLNWSGV